MDDVHELDLEASGVLAKVRALVERYAIVHYDGHITYCRFGDGWKAMFGTQNPTCDPIDRKNLWETRPHATLYGAAVELLAKLIQDGTPLATKKDMHLANTPAVESLKS